MNESYIVESSIFKMNYATVKQTEYLHSKIIVENCNTTNEVTINYWKGIAHPALGH